VQAKDLFSFGLGGAALVLSIYNTWRARDADRVRLKVTPKLYRMIGSGMLTVSTSPRLKRLVAEHGLPGIAIEVANLGKFAVTIDEIGFCLGCPSKDAGHRH
jgi:hypothetical protein